MHLESAGGLALQYRFFFFPTTKVVIIQFFRLFVRVSPALIFHFPYQQKTQVSDALEGLPLARADSSTAVAGGSADKVQRGPSRDAL